MQSLIVGGNEDIFLREHEIWMWWWDLQKEVWVQALYEHDIISLQAQVHHKHINVSKNLKYQSLEHEKY